MKKTPTSIRISEKAKALLQNLSTDLDISQTAVLEIAIRDLAERKNISPNERNNKKMRDVPAV